MQFNLELLILMNGFEFYPLIGYSRTFIFPQDKLVFNEKRFGGIIIPMMA